MELGVPAKQRYVASSVNQSLLKLAVKLREAELRVRGRTSQVAVPSRNALLGVSSTVHRGRFQFVARRKHKNRDFSALGYCNSNDLATMQNTEVFSTNKLHTSMAAGGGKLTDTDVMINTTVTPVGHKLSEADIMVNAAVLGSMHPLTTHTLSIPDKTGPSLWPFLSSIKASVDAEHCKFLEKNQRFYANYEKSRIVEDYTQPLSVSDFEVIISHAVDTILQTSDSRVPQQMQVQMQMQMPTTTNEPCMSLPVPIAPKPVQSVDIPPAFQGDDSSPVSGQSGQLTVSKRYAAAIANPRRFKCELCPYSTNNRSHVRRHHISVHSEARPYRCYVCNKEFARCENAKVHMVSRHPEVPYSVDRLRSDHFFKTNSSGLSIPTDEHSAPFTDIQSSVPERNTGSPDTDTSKIDAEWYIDREAKRPRLEPCQSISPWLNVPKIEPKLDPREAVLHRENGGNHLAESTPQSMYHTHPNNVFSAPPVGIVKQEPSFVADGTTSGHSSSVSDHHKCLYCNYMCRNAAELAMHFSTIHGSLNSPPHLPLASNPGYVVLQTAAPIFLFPYGSEPVLPNRGPLGQGYHPILPKVPTTVEKCQSPNGVSDEQHFTKRRSPSNVPNDFMPSSSLASEISDAMPEKLSGAHSAEDKPRVRQRKFKTFYCSRCPDRAPFRYEKSFKKHLKQHQFEDRQKQQ